MRAIRLHPPGRIDDLRLEEIELPAPRSGEVLVQVHGAAITRDELEWPADRLPAIPSYELSGVVAEDAGAMVAGAEVYGLTPFDRDRVAADYAVVPVEVLALKPSSLNHIQAAALPMAGLSAWQGLVVHGRLQPGERVAISGARGGRHDSNSISRRGSAAPISVKSHAGRKHHRRLDDQVLVIAEEIGVEHC